MSIDIVRGTVEDENGHCFEPFSIPIFVGSGFSVEVLPHDSVEFIITFDRPFLLVPAVVASSYMTEDFPAPSQGVKAANG